MLEMITTASRSGSSNKFVPLLLQSKWKKCKSAKKALPIAAQTSFMCYVLINFDDAFCSAFKAKSVGF